MYQTPIHACSDYYWEWLINIVTPCMSSYSTHQEVIELAIYTLYFAHIIILTPKYRYNNQMAMDSIYIYVYFTSVNIMW